MFGGWRATPTRSTSDGSADYYYCYSYYYNLTARRHKLGCLCLRVLISARAYASCLADLRARVPIGTRGLSTERLRRSLTARLRREGLIPNRIAHPGTIILFRITILAPT